MIYTQILLPFWFTDSRGGDELQKGFKPGLKMIMWNHAMQAPAQKSTRYTSQYVCCFGFLDPNQSLAFIFTSLPT
jgi:hypothetical protein